MTLAEIHSKNDDALARATEAAMTTAVKEYFNNGRHAGSEKIVECENFINTKGDSTTIEYALRTGRLKKPAGSSRYYIQLRT